MHKVRQRADRQRGLLVAFYGITGGKERSGLLSGGNFSVSAPHVALCVLFFLRLSPSALSHTGGGRYSDISKWVIQWVRVGLGLVLGFGLRLGLRLELLLVAPFQKHFVGIAAVRIA